MNKDRALDRKHIHVVRFCVGSSERSFDTWLGIRTDK